MITTFQSRFFFMETATAYEDLAHFVGKDRCDGTACNFNTQIVWGHTKDDRRVSTLALHRHDDSAHAAGGRHPVAGFDVAQHRLPFLLFALLRKDEQEIEDGKDADHHHQAESSRRPALKERCE